VRRLLVLLAAAVAAASLAPLGSVTVASAASGPLDAIAVSGSPGEKPTVTSKWPFSVKSSVSEVRTAGTGTEAARGDQVSIDYVILNGRTGAEIETSYGAAPVALKLAKGTTPALLKALVGTTEGSRVLVAVAPKDGIAKGGASVGLKKSDTVLFVVDVKDVTTPLTRATGTPVIPGDGNLPTVTLAKNGAPSISMPKAAAPTNLVVQPLIKGDGPVVQPGQTIDVQYTGAIWDSGKVFDSSWKRGGASVQFPIGTGSVIAGWDEGLVGQTVGSQVLLVIPPGKGYGASGQPAAGIKGTDTLVFVVDILGAT
jgi:peptidylprolyl isomerase